jgi:GNAT superfamily N-acetyltransferase
MVSAPPTEHDRDSLAALLLGAYRDTVDDEGEDLADAYVAIDEYWSRIVRNHSFVVREHAAIVAFSFVLVVNELHYIDPIAVAPARRRSGLGRDTVLLSLASLARAGVSEVGATITDGNLPSERLFARLGFARYGTWT